MKPMSDQAFCRRFGWLLAMGITLLLAGLATNRVFGQQREGHSLYPAGLPTGYVGQGALLQPLPMQGYYQPVKVILPEGTAVAFAANESFVIPDEVPVQVGLLVGRVYRFQITQIPYYSGAELYPTLEIINRLYPPPGKEDEFPVEIEITQDDMEIALSGRLVTRVIYLEDPLSALATRGEEKVSLSLTLEPSDHPMTEAQRKGRPMAILRMGNRQFAPGESDSAFFFGSPPWFGRPEPFVP
ncbi:MAG: hypothetical protein FWD31_01045 [Planctomycetaceae bacterium]|nr:hypothetical protein [Planctomycetaceae bacterium]